MVAVQRSALVGKCLNSAPGWSRPAHHLGGGEPGHPDRHERLQRRLEQRGVVSAGAASWVRGGAAGGRLTARSCRGTAWTASAGATVGAGVAAGDMAGATGRQPRSLAQHVADPLAPGAGGAQVPADGGVPVKAMTRRSNERMSLVRP